MTPALKAVLEAHHVAVFGRGGDVNFGFDSVHRTEFEPYCQLRAGIYQVGRIGSFTYLGGGRSIFRNIASIGRFCSIAGNVVAGQVEHPADFVSAHPILQGGWNPGFAPLDAFATANAGMLALSKRAYLERFGDRATKITIGNDVWIGEGAFLRRGVSIGDGAVVAGRSVVVRDVPPYTIVGGVPARAIRLRFPEAIVERYLALGWWRYGLEILVGVDNRHPETAIGAMEERVASGAAVPFEPETFVLPEMPERVPPS